jgi:hypothetical protein
VGLLQRVIGESDNDENNSQQDEASQLDWFATQSVYGSNGDPVPRDSACTDQDEIADCRIVEDLVDVLAASISNGSEDDRVVQTKTVES